MVNDISSQRNGGGAWLIVASITSAQLGASIASGLFDEVAPPVVVFFRQLITGLVLVTVSRPKLGEFDRHQLGAIVAFGAVMSGMSLLFYESVARLPLALAVTIELTGPLALGLALSRRRRDLLLGLAAVGGVLMIRAASLSTEGARTSGLLFALGAGACWAGYILLNRRLGRQGDGFGGLGLGMLAASLFTLPFGIAGGVGPALQLDRLGRIVAVALLSGLMTFSFELLALRRLAARTVAVLFSLSPVIAAAVARVILGEALTAAEVAGMVMIVAVSAAVVRSDNEDVDTVAVLRFDDEDLGTTTSSVGSESIRPHPRRRWPARRMHRRAGSTHGGALALDGCAPSTTPAAAATTQTIPSASRATIA